jgi:hypothetical protein
MTDSIGSYRDRCGQIITGAQDVIDKVYDIARDCFGIDGDDDSSIVIFELAAMGDTVDDFDVSPDMRVGVIVAGEARDIFDNLDIVSERGELRGTVFIGISAIVPGSDLTAIDDRSTIGIARYFAEPPQSIVDAFLLAGFTDALRIPNLGRVFHYGGLRIVAVTNADPTQKVPPTTPPAPEKRRNFAKRKGVDGAFVGNGGATPTSKSKRPRAICVEKVHVPHCHPSMVRPHDLNTICPIKACRMAHTTQDCTRLGGMSDEEILFGQHVSHSLVKRSTEVVGPDVGLMCTCDDGTCPAKVRGCMWMRIPYVTTRLNSNVSPPPLRHAHPPRAQHSAELDLRRKLSTDEHRDTPVFLCTKPCQSGKMNDTTLMCRQEAFDRGNVPIILSKNDGGAGDIRTFCIELERLNDVTRDIVEKLLWECEDGFLVRCLQKSGTAQELDFLSYVAPEARNGFLNKCIQKRRYIHDMYCMKVNAPSLTNGTSSGFDPESISDGIPCVYLGPCNSTTTKAIATILLPSILARHENIVDVMRDDESIEKAAKLVLLRDEADLHAVSSCRIGANEKAEDKDHNFGGFECTVRTAPLRTIHITATPGALASSEAEKKYRVGVLISDLSDYYFGYERVTRRTVKTSVFEEKPKKPSIPIRKCSCTDEKWGQLMGIYDARVAQWVEDCATFAASEKKCPYGRHRHGVEEMFDVIAAESVPCHAVIVTDTTIKLADQEVWARKTGEYLEGKRVLSLIYTWCAEYCTIRFSSGGAGRADRAAMSAWHAACKKAADGLRIKMVLNGEGTLLRTGGGVTSRDILDLAAAIHDEAVCTSEGCGNNANMNLKDMPPAFCEDHASSDMSICTRPTVVGIAGILANRGVPLRDHKHGSHPRHLYLDRSISQNKVSLNGETNIQVNGRAYGIIEDLDGAVVNVWASQQNHATYREMLDVIEIIKTEYARMSSFDVLNELAGTEYLDNDSINATLLDIRQKKHAMMTRSKLQVPFHKVAAKRAAAIKASGLDPVQVAWEARERIVATIATVPTSVHVTDTTDTDNEGDGVEAAADHVGTKIHTFMAMLKEDEVYTAWEIRALGNKVFKAFNRNHMTTDLQGHTYARTHPNGERHTPLLDAGGGCVKKNMSWMEC